MSDIKRYAEHRTQDEYGEMQEGTYESATGEYVFYTDHVAALEEHKESLLASGELLRRDELVAWLKDHCFVADSITVVSLQSVLDHINTKKAVSQVGVVATDDIPLENIGPVIEAGDLLVQDGATQRTTIVATSFFDERPPASGRERLTWYVDYRAGETEYRVVEQLPER